MSTVRDPHKHEIVSIFFRPWLLAVCIAVSVFLFRLPFWISRTFGEVGLEQFLFHIFADTTGTPWHLIRRGIRELVIKPFAIGASIYFLAKALIWFHSGKKILLYVFYSLIYACSLALVSIGGVKVVQVIGIAEYLEAPSSKVANHRTDWMKDWYVKPAIVKPIVGRPKNIIWLYVESLEASRVKPNLHPLLTNMNTLAHVTFHNLPGSTWTIGGMVSSQCGVPLLPYGLHSGNGFIDAPRFMPGAVCIGDLLKDLGYQTVFVGGADSNFAGKGNFLRQHGYQKVIGKEEIQQMTGLNTPKDWWGFTDDVVLKITADEIKRLKSTGLPFFISALTADTHGPRGYLSEYCRQHGGHASIEKIFDCVIVQAERFVEQLKAARILDDTVLVISGDHPFMEPKPLSLNPFDRPVENRSRTVYFMVIRPDGVTFKVSHMNHLDMYPTVLAAAGVRIEDGAAGLGRNLYDRESLSKNRDYSELKRIFRTKSAAYNRLWQ